jgi:hypothetical protein
MRSHEVFARMSPTQIQAFLAELRAEAPQVSQMALAAGAGAFKLRPAFLKRQSPAKQAEWVRKALARGAMATVAEEILAEYFLGRHKPLLVEWLDAVGLEHDEGVLKTNAPPPPDPGLLRKAFDTFSSGENPERRRLLLLAFAAQSAIDWPELEALLTPPPAEA